MGEFRRLVLGVRLHTNVDSFLDNTSKSDGDDGFAREAKKARRRLVERIVPAIKEELDEEGARRAFHMAVKTAKLKSTVRGFNNAAIAELETLLR